MWRDRPRRKKPEAEAQTAPAEVPKTAAADATSAADLRFSRVDLGAGGLLALPF